MSNQSNGTDKNNETTTQLVAILQEQMSINQAQILANQKQLQVNEALTQEVKLLREQIAYLTNKLYGKSKESLPESLSGQLSLDLFGDPVVPLAIQEEEISVQPHKRKKGTKAKKLNDFPTKEVHCELTEEERHCQQCGTTMSDMGIKKAREEIAFHQARIETLQYVQHSYCCKACERVGDTSLKKAPVPKPLLSNSLASPSLVAETMFLKFIQKVPAYRQEKYWQQLRLDISRDNITNWHIRVGQDFLSILVERLHQELVKRTIAYADETTYRVLESQKQNNYYWVFSTSKQEEDPIVLYHHSESQGNDVPKKFLKNFQGYLHCDGYSVYDGLANVLPVRCLAHVRRKFHEALPKELGETIHPAAYVLDAFKECFKKEKAWKDLLPAERLEKRQKELRPLLDQLYAYVETIPAVPKSKLEKAIEYMCKHRESVEHVFEDGRLELTNNQSERFVKELVIGRKNYLFSSSLAGAQTSGYILSVMNEYCE